MSKDEAIQAMREGKKVTHPTFTDEEYIQLKGNVIITEEGYEIFLSQFFAIRNSVAFNTGWKIFEANG